MAVVMMNNKDVGCWMKNGFAAKVFMVNEALGCGLRQKANKIFS